MATNDKPTDKTAPDNKGARAPEGAERAPERTESAEESDYIWVISNRKDDRVVLFERDPRHPGGEAFIGGSAPDRVARTAEIDRLLHTGEIIQIPEPPESKKKPVEFAAVVSGTPAAQPGQAIQLGRKLDPEIVPEGAQGRVRAMQSRLPEKIASKATVPPPPPSEKETERG